MFQRARGDWTAHLKPDSVSNIMTAALERAGLPGTGKSYRPSVATKVAQAGGSWAEVRAITRHDSLDTLLDHYIRHAPSEERTSLALGLSQRPNADSRAARKAVRSVMERLGGAR
jgi:hypothetical protein